MAAALSTFFFLISQWRLGASGISGFRYLMDVVSSFPAFLNFLFFALLSSWFQAVYRVHVVLFSLCVS